MEKINNFNENEKDQNGNASFPSELDKITEELSKRGLNKPREWALILMKNIPISNMQGLKRLKPNYFGKIESMIENEMDREVLLEIFNFDNTKRNLNGKKITEFDKIVEKLESLYLNDSTKWAKILIEKVPISYAELLNHLRPCYFFNIERYIKNHIDSNILKKLFNVVECKNKEERIEEQKERKQRIDKLMIELNGYKSANNMNQDEIDGKLTALMAELDLNPSGLSPTLSIEEL